MTAQHPQDLDVAGFIRSVRPALAPTLLAAALLGGAGYLLTSRQPQEYVASSSIAALPLGGNASALSNTVITAPPLPGGVVIRALRGPTVTGQAIETLKATLADNPEARRLGAVLNEELRTGDYRTLSVAVDIDQSFSGSYVLSVRSQDARVSQAAADAFAQALLDWDRQRAQQGLERARQNLQAQLADSGAGAGPFVDGNAAESRRNTLRQLQQVDLLTQTISGTLSLISPASLPAQPSAPRPLRNALLIFGAALFFGLLLAALRARLLGRVQHASALPALGLPVVAELPQVTRRGAPNLDTAVLSSDAFRQQLEFVRVELQQLRVRHPQVAPVIVITGAGPQQGASVVTAALAALLGERQIRVLVVEADPAQQRQQALLTWAAAVRTQITLRVIPVTAPPAEGPAHPSGRHAVDLLLPPSTPLDSRALYGAIGPHRPGYDIILVDAPPALNVADTLDLARLSDGMLIVTGRDTPVTFVERLLVQSRRMNVTLLGTVFNRSGSVPVTRPDRPIPSPRPQEARP